jgi:hypothetical protein
MTNQVVNTGGPAQQQHQQQQTQFSGQQSFQG